MANVLVVDDDPEFVDTTRMVLEAHGHKVDAASSAADGMKAVDTQPPDLIILDVIMESLGAGFSLAQQLRASKHKDIPILMVTTISRRTGFKFDPAEDKEFLPVDGFVEKPIKPQELLERVESMLKK